MFTIEDFGQIDSIYFAYSADEKIRFGASSGGFIKSLLVYLLESQTVDAAIITRTGDSSNPLVPETIITSLKEDIISTRTNSVYVINNPLKVLKAIEPDKKYAFVGLPCQIKTLRTLQNTGNYLNITVIISLFCNHTPNIEFTKEILQKLDVKEQGLKQIEYRGNGWPGGFTALLTNGQKKYIPLIEYWSNDLDNGPLQCKYCSEIGREADFYVGDPWNLELERTDDKGASLVICRNSTATTLVKRSAELNYIRIKICSPKILLKSQGIHVEQKKNRGKGKITGIKPGNSPGLVKRVLNLIIHPVKGYKVGKNVLSFLLNDLKKAISGAKRLRQ
jgi:coenzyme F420 hydrogenase subunit beta